MLAAAIAGPGGVTVRQVPVPHASEDPAQLGLDVAGQ